MFKNNIKWSKEQIQAQLIKWIEVAKTKVDDLLSWNNIKINNEVTENLKKDISEDIYYYLEYIDDESWYLTTQTMYKKEIK